MTPPPIIDDPDRKIKYSVSRGDILRWHVYVISRNRVIIVFGLVLSLVFAWSDLRTPDLAAESIGFKIFYTVFFSGTMFCIYVLATMVLMAFTVMFKKFRGFLGEHELEIREEGLLERTDVNESLHRWAGFHKIASTRRHLYIYVTDNNVHVVPRRYFASEQQERAFRDELERHINASKKSLSASG